MARKVLIAALWKFSSCSSSVIWLEFKRQKFTFWNLWIGTVTADWSDFINVRVVIFFWSLWLNPITKSSQSVFTQVLSVSCAGSFRLNWTMPFEFLHSTELRDFTEQLITLLFIVDANVKVIEELVFTVWTSVNWRRPNPIDVFYLISHSGRIDFSYRPSHVHLRFYFELSVSPLVFWRSFHIASRNHWPCLINNLFSVLSLIRVLSSSPSSTRLVSIR